VARREPEHVYRRRRLAALAVLAVAAVGAVLAGRAILGNDDEIENPAASPAPDPLAGVSLQQLLGQRLMVRMTDSATPQLVELARRGTIGGVILFPPPDARPRELSGEVERLQRAASRGDNPPLLVAVDQEGGPVKRLPAGPPDRSPAELGDAGDEAAARTEGAGTAAYLTRFGVSVDLAPVLDVPEAGSFVAGRAFGTDPGTVSRLGVAFAEGLAAGGVAATAKHFPGLGSATVNTDVAPSVVDASRPRLRDAMAPFRAAAESGVGLVMLSNATYTALDPDTPAPVSRRVVRELREGLGFDGVVITDDLLAGAIASNFSAPDAAVEAARAGADVLLFAGAIDPGEITRALLRAARNGRLDRSALEASYLRIAAVKGTAG
jgi:beta-N-acetylhexosaminidase